MRKTLTLCLAFAIVLSLVGMAQATAKQVPKGTLVSAVTDEQGHATITVSGTQVSRIEFYAWSELRRYKDKSAITVDTHDGVRFQFVFRDEQGEWFALITKEMETNPPEWFGLGVGAKCLYNPQIDRTDCALVIKK